MIAGKAIVPVQMPGELIHPYAFQRLPVSKPWAGRRLVEIYAEIEDDLPIGTGETIEAASYDAAQTLITNGPAAGHTVEELIRMVGWREVVGVETTDLPIMLKLLDSSQPLSVQVHPGDVLGAPGGPPIRRGKDECWLVLEAQPGAVIWQGVKPGIQHGEAWGMLEAGRINEVMHAREVATGDFIDNPAGMVHAIGGGLVLLELQQACATTLRIYDWVKPNSTARLRPMHPRDARSVARLELPLPELISVAPENMWPPGKIESKAAIQEITVLRDTGPFSWRSLVVTAPLRNRSRVARARLLTVLAGHVTVVSGGTEVEVSPPNTVMIPAGLREWSLLPGSGAAWVMDARVNW